MVRAKESKSFTMTNYWVDSTLNCIKSGLIDKELTPSAPSRSNWSNYYYYLFGSLRLKQSIALNRMRRLSTPTLLNFIKNTF